MLWSCYNPWNGRRNMNDQWMTRIAHCIPDTRCSLPRLQGVTTGVHLVVGDTDHGCGAELGIPIWGSFVNWGLSFPLTSSFPLLLRLLLTGACLPLWFTETKLLGCQASCSAACEPMTPALAGRFFTTAPPGKPSSESIFDLSHNPPMCVPIS